MIYHHLSERDVGSNITKNSHLPLPFHSGRILPVKRWSTAFGASLIAAGASTSSVVFLLPRSASLQAG
jgi:hypothetical protein